MGKKGYTKQFYYCLYLRICKRIVLASREWFIVVLKLGLNLILFE